MTNILSSLPFLGENPLSAVNGEPYELLLPLGLILLFSKLISLLLGKLKIPQVVGFLIGGLLVGCIFFIPNQTILTDYTMTGINDLAKIGVILILFSAGLGTDLKQIKAEGVASVVITSLGVIVPLGLGFLAAWLFLDPTLSNPYEDIYYGVILTATSVSITVATLKELGRLKSRVGTALVAAAILDDIIGVILLSVVIALSGKGSGNVHYTGNTAWDIIILLLIMVGFFAVSFVLGIFVHKLFDWMGKKWPNHRRIPMFSLAFCFIWSYLAEKFFNIADITGAYVAGLILANTSAMSYVDKRTDEIANLLFIPVFFASVALKMFTSFNSGLGVISWQFVLFGIVWIFVGLLGKVVGAGTGSLISKFKFKDSLRIGIGMMARAEVLIVTAQKGVDSGLVNPMIIPFTLGLILVSSFVTPILLKLLYKNEPPESGKKNELPPPLPQTEKKV